MIGLVMGRAELMAFKCKTVYLKSTPMIDISHRSFMSENNEQKYRILKSYNPKMNMSARSEQVFYRLT